VGEEKGTGNRLEAQNNSGVQKIDELREIVEHASGKGKKENGGSYYFIREEKNMVPGERQLSHLKKTFTSD